MAYWFARCWPAVGPVPAVRRCSSATWPACATGAFLLACASDAAGGLVPGMRSVIVDGSPAHPRHAAALAFRWSSLPVVLPAFTPTPPTCSVRSPRMSRPDRRPAGPVRRHLRPDPPAVTCACRNRSRGLGLARVRLIPAGQPPHRATPARAATIGWRWPPRHRRQPGLRGRRRRSHAAQASFTILTLERLRAELGPTRPLVLLLGVDAFLGLPPGGAGPSFSTSPIWPSPTAPATPSTRRGCPPRWPPRRPLQGPRPPCRSPAGAMVQFEMTPGDLRHRHPRRRGCRDKACVICSPRGC